MTTEKGSYFRYDPALIAQNIQIHRQTAEKAMADSGRAGQPLRLMAVTKTVPPEGINAAIEAGIDLIGENRVQELLEKLPHIKREGVEIHFIGHLQTNKVRQIIDKVDMIQSVDSIKLAREIDLQAGKVGRVMDVLLEVNIAAEPSKNGFAPTEISDTMLEEITTLGNIRLRGIMAIPPICTSESEIAKYFREINQIYVDTLMKKSDNEAISVLSMGMSGDYVQAIKQGSTMIRLGQAIFGAR